MSCKRIKLSTPQIKKYHHNNAFEPPSRFRHAAVRSVDELGDAQDDLTLDSDPTTVILDGDTCDRKTLSRNRNATKNKRSGCYGSKAHMKFWHADLFHLGISLPGTTGLRTIILTTGILPIFPRAQS
jgi:hypothetical protein